MNVTVDTNIDLGNLFSWEKSEPPNSPDLLLGDDPIAITCAAYRFFKQTGIRYAELTTMEPTAADREQAASLRKYYADRLLMATLTNQTGVGVSEFRRKLYGVVTDTYQLKKSDLGMLYRLPYFYVEDTETDQVMAATTVATAEEATTEYQTGQFTLFKQILVSRRGGDYIQFWLNKSGSTSAYLVVVKADNPLLSLLQSIITQSIQLKYRAFPKRPRGVHYDHVYYQLGSLELVS